MDGGHKLARVAYERTGRHAPAGRNERTPLVDVFPAISFAHGAKKNPAEAGFFRHACDQKRNCAEIP
ncbi:hypothetical protein GCM10027564_19800 [Luteimonas notoginsengisoli]